MRRRFLVVEDDPLVAMMLENYLEAMDRQPVGIVGRVCAALAETDARNIDAAIVDIHLESGETAEPVVEKLSAMGIPFMVATGGFIKPPWPAFVGCPVLLKPFTFASLAHAIDELG